MDSNAPGARDRFARWRPWVLAVALGVFAGLGTFTFRYAEGLSYFSTRPEACANCHIMQSQFDGWQKASHHTAAVCVDCHLPHAFVPKYLAKAENGWRHSQKFTTQNFAEPIVVQGPGREILQANCLRCHGAVVEAMNLHPGTADSSCTHCHAAVGHGVRAGLGGPLRNEEIERLLGSGPSPSDPEGEKR